MNQVHQEDWLTRAKAVLPAGGFGNFDASIVIRDGLGARVRDEDGKEYIDYLIGSGPMLVGHGHPEVLAAVQEQLSKGLTFFANNARGIELAEVICHAVSCADQLRYVSTGGEADMYAMRLARAHTGRDRIMKFEGGYHGMSAEALMSLSPTARVNFPQAVPDSAGIPESVRQSMIIAPFNDGDAAVQLLEEYGDDVAAIIVEPLQRLIPPTPGFLQLLRDEATKRGIVLIFDEVVTGFRLAYGGAQEHYGVVPDICTLGKIIGGGFPLAAIAGTHDIMSHFDKSIVGADRFTFQVGTLSGNPVASVAGLKTLEILRRPGVYDTIRGYGNTLMQGLSESLNRQGIVHSLVGDPVLFDVVFGQTDVIDYRTLQQGDAKASAVFNQALRTRGILKSPSKLYPSLALTDDDIEYTLQAFDYAADCVAAD